MSAKNETLQQAPFLGIIYSTPPQAFIPLFHSNSKTDFVIGSIEMLQDWYIYYYKSEVILSKNILKTYFTQIHIQNIQKLGSNKKPVEVDQNCFRRKYQRERIYRTQTWVFGLVERNAGFDRCIFLAVPDRQSEMLIPIIESFVTKKVPLLISDQWKFYKPLKSLNYHHETINHSRNFVIPKSNTNIKRGKQIRRYGRVKGFTILTQTIENRWKYLKQRMKLKVGKRLDLMESIYESQFNLYSKDNLCENLLELYKKVYYLL